jgi:hypothetical protein
MKDGFMVDVESLELLRIEKKLLHMAVVMKTL